MAEVTVSLAVSFILFSLFTVPISLFTVRNSHLIHKTSLIAGRPTQVVIFVRAGKFGKVTEFGVAVIPGVAFGLADGCFIRISYGALAEDSVNVGVERLVKGIKTLAERG